MERKYLMIELCREKATMAGCASVLPLTKDACSEERGGGVSREGGLFQILTKRGGAY